MTDTELTECLDMLGEQLTGGRYRINDLLLCMFNAILEVHQSEYAGAKQSCDMIYQQTYSSRRKQQSQYFANSIKGFEYVKKRIKQTYKKSEIIERFMQNVKSLESEG